MINILSLLVYFMFFSIQRMNLSASDLFSSESVKIGQAARINSKLRHIGTTEVVPLRSLNK